MARSTEVTTALDIYYKRMDLVPKQSIIYSRLTAYDILLSLYVVTYIIQRFVCVSCISVDSNNDFKPKCYTVIKQISWILLSIIRFVYDAVNHVLDRAEYN